MYLSPRSAQVRNLSVAVVNGSITLVILLIAPLGLAAVIINTLLVTFATFITATAADRIVLYLQGDRSQRMDSMSSGQSAQIRQQNPSDLDRR